MRRTGLTGVTVAAITIAISGCSDAPSPEERLRVPAGVGAGGAGANLKSDDDFVRDVAAKNMAELELSRMALDKSTDANIKVFAQQMIDEHSAAADELKSVVSGQPIEWPAQLDDDHQETVNELASKQGAEFDRGYMEAMIEGHQNLAAKLEARLDPPSLAEWKTAAAGRTQSSALPDPNAALGDVQVRPIKSDNELTMRINQWAADTYPVAQKHLDTARALDNATRKRSRN